MKRFKFRLDPVIRYREYRERIDQISLAKETQALVESKNRISEIDQAMRYTTSELDSEQKQGIEVNRHLVLTAYLQGLSDEIESEKERLLEINKRIIEKQEAAKIATMKKKTLEWLKQTQYSKYFKWLNQEEQKAADEMTGLKKYEV